jgi:hypothetical protein
VRNQRRLALVVASFGLCGGCARPAALVHTPAAARDPVWGSDVVTASDLAAGGEGQSVFVALQYARPSFLGTDRERPAVSLDDSFVTDVSILSTLSLSDICEIALQRGTSGVGHPLILSNGAVSSGGDVLLVRTRRSGQNMLRHGRSHTDRRGSTCGRKESTNR